MTIKKNYLYNIINVIFFTNMNENNTARVLKYKRN